MKGRVIKWDAAQLPLIPQPRWQLAARALAAIFGRDLFPPQHAVPDMTGDFDPRTVAACVEIVEMNDGQLPQTVFRR